MAYSYMQSALFILIISLAVIYIYPIATIFISHADVVRPITNPTPPAIFIFGDSTADVGTNNYVLDNRFRADIPPYGIDIDDSRPNGRFGNGLITVDFLCQLMGFKRSPPPFLFLNTLRTDFEKKQFRGVNFASAGSGLFNTTQAEQKIIPMSEQVSQFNMVQSHLAAWMGQTSLSDLLSKSIFIVSVGSNDILVNFMMNNTMPQELFIHNLLATYEQEIKALYSLGARKIGMISPLLIGCCPILRVLNSTGGCLDVMNEVSMNFYLELRTRLYKISSELPGFKYSLGNTYKMTMDVLENPARFNFTNVDSACCGSGRFNAEQPCNVTGNLCDNRSEYAYWDFIHPTQKAAKLTAQSLYDGELRLVSPINFGQLVAA